LQARGKTWWEREDGGKGGNVDWGCPGSENACGEGRWLLRGSQLNGGASWVVHGDIDGAGAAVIVEGQLGPGGSWCGLGNGGSGGHWRERERKR